MEVETKNGNLLRVEFECCTVPRYNVCANKDWISWGKDNAYPNFLLFLDNRNAYHGSIIQAKSDYIFGKGLSYDKDELTMLQQAQYSQFLSRANDNEDWNDIFRKNCKPGEIFNGVCLQIVWKINGKCDVFSMNPGHFRTNAKGNKYYYCEAWSQYNSEGILLPNPNPEDHESYRTFNAFNPKIRTGAQILFYKAPFLTLEEYGHLYPQPNYIQVIQDVETDIEITNFHYNGLKNGMSASSIVSLFNGEPELPEQRKIAAKFKNKHTGSNNAGGFIINFVDKGGTPADIKNLTMSDLDKMFEVLGKRLQQNIFSGHRFDPILGGIMQEGQLGGAKEILEKYDKFVKTYIHNRQEMHLNIIRMIGDVNGVDLSELEVKQMTPVREELPVDQITVDILGADVIKKYLSKRYDIDVEESDIEVAKMEALPVNENIKNMKGAEYRRLQNMIAKFKAGKMQRSEIELWIKGHGLGQDYIDTVLGKQAQFSEEVDVVLKAFEACAIDDNTEDEIVHEEFICNGIEALESNFNAVKKVSEMKFEASLRDQILELLKGDPSLNAEKIAKQLGKNIKTVNESLKLLAEEELIIVGRAVNTPTQKGLDKKTVDIQYETYTVYEYVTRPNVPETETSSRNFCKRMMALSRSGKRWTKEGIDNIYASVKDQLAMPDFDPWIYRGGFYTNPDTQETTPYCRHIWKSITKTRRKQ